MEKGTKVLLGVGCGCVGLGGLVTAVAVAFFLMAGSDGGELIPYPDGPPPLPLDTQLGVPPVAVGEPRDQAFAAYVNGAATAAYAAARGASYDTSWNGADPRRDLRAVDPATRTQLDALGPAQLILVTIIELEATDGSARVRSNVAVFPDGRVRWAKASRDTIPTTPTANLATAAPALAAEATRMLETLAGPCDLPLLSPADLPTLTPDIQADILRDAAETPRACAPGASLSGWQPKVDDVTILVSGNGRLAMLRTELEVDGASLYLGTPEVRTVP